MGKSNEYIRLFNFYKNQPKEELEEIANNKDDEYSAIAQEVARDILSPPDGGVKELEKEIVKETRVKERQRNEERVLNNLDRNVFQMAKDIRFLKNVVIAMLIAEGIIAFAVVIALTNLSH